MARVIPEESVFIAGLDANETMAIVKELRQHGLVQGKDFDFKYKRTTYSDDGWTVAEPKGAEFYFYKAKWRTFFAIKYAV